MPNIPLNNLPVKEKECDLTAWMATVAELRHEKHTQYYKINQRAVRELNAPQFHFYTRIVKLANFRTGKGNTTRQFKYFGGHWKRSTIYEHLASLEEKGFIRPRETRSRYFQPRTGGKTLWVNKRILDQVSSRQDALFFKLLSYIIINSKRIHLTTCRSLIDAGFCADDSLIFARWIRDQLTQSRLKSIVSATVWIFKKLTTEPVLWLRGKVPFRRFRNDATKTGQDSRAVPFYISKKASNGALRNTPTGPQSGPDDEPPENTGGHWDAPAAPRNTQRRDLAQNFDVHHAGQSLCVFRGDATQRLSANSHKEQDTERDFDHVDTARILFESLPDNLKPRFRLLKKFFLTKK